MVPNVVDAYDIGVDVLSGVGVLYLLLTERELMDQRHFFTYVTVGILVYVAAEPFDIWFAPWVTHAVHGLGLLLIAIGVARPVFEEITDDEWARLLVDEPETIRPRQPWMTPLDDEIMRLFHASGLVLSPALIAYNIDYSRDEVNRRLSVLAEHDLLARVERGKYELTDAGELYFYGEADERTGVLRSVTSSLLR